MKDRLLKHSGLWFLGILLAGCLALPLPSFGAEKRMVVDQLGRVVAVPVKVDRVVCLMHHGVDILIELGAADRLVGITRTWQKDLPAGITKICPALKKLPTPGGLNEVNMEELLRLKPDLVIVTHYAPKDMIQQMEDAGVPVLALALYKARYEEASRLNPKLKNPDQAYTEGMREGITLLGEVLGVQPRAKALLDFTFKWRNLARARTAGIPRGDRTTCYMANPDLYTYGTGKYTGVIMDRAGGVNVAEGINGYAQVTMEQLLLWNPQVIFVQDRYAKVAEQIRKDPTWGKVRAVRDRRVYLTPEYVKPWGHPCPESMALGELWMAKKLYPARFADIDIQPVVNEFYTRFYGIPYPGDD